MKKIYETLNTKRFKHIMHATIALLLLGWVLFRFGAVASENARYVFNASRVAADVGAPVQVLEMDRKTGVLYEPLAVKNNRAYVTGARAKKLHAGQRVGDGRIVSVSGGLDLDTGMFVVRTRDVPDGLHYAEFSANGFFVPLHAIRDNVVMIAQDGIATPRTITVLRSDSETAYVTAGLASGDVVILSTVNAGDKVSIQDSSKGI